MTEAATISRREMLQCCVLGTQYCGRAGISPPQAGRAQVYLRLPSDVDTWTVFARDVEVTDELLTFKLSDGRTISAPLKWYPRLVHGTPVERNHWELGSGVEVHWPDLDEDISVENLLHGQLSGESPKSVQRWLDSRHSRVAG